MKSKKYTRRQMLWQSGLASLGTGLLPLIGRGADLSTRRKSAFTQTGEYKTYFGDIHNHNEVGYAKGGLKRSFEIATNQHLDFYALTPHAHWNDIEKYEGGIENKWHKGFERTKNRWPEVLDLVKEYNKPGDFITFPGYEWHSSNMGDYHVIFPDGEAELFLPDTLKELQEFVRHTGAIMVPHHLANILGRRGANFIRRDPSVSPVVEVYSEWGNAVSDKGPYPYIRHSPGGRWTKNTLEYRLSKGDRMGIVASTDDHLGKPGAYSQGLAVVWAKELSREAIFDAFWNRRTYAVTGDRIELDFRINGHLMGQELSYSKQRNIDVSVSGWDQVSMVEVIKNNRVIHRDFPMDREPSSNSWENPVLIWFEYGWGPWADLNMASVTEWDVDFNIQKGTLDSVQPAFRAGPFEESYQDQILNYTENSLILQSFTSRRDEFEDQAQKGLVLKVKGGPDTQIKITTKKPTEREWEFRMINLMESNEVLLTGRYPKATALLHRPVFRENYQTQFQVEDTGDGKQTDWYYVRVTQANRQYAWSSPIWVEKA